MTLDAGSFFSYPQRFEGDAREVFLKGEGYFEVTHKVHRPFIVHADDAIIQVLGTKFNVRAWPQAKKVKVAVAEGKVSLGSEVDSDEGAVVIEKGQLSVLTAKGKPSQPVGVNIDDHLAWMNDEMIFEDAPLHDVLYQLERWYDLQFVLADSSIAAEHINVHIHKKSIDDILELISALTDLRHQREGSIIRLWSEGRHE